MCVKPRRVLEGAEASACLGPQAAVVAVPGGFRGKVPVRRVESFLVRQDVSVADGSDRVAGRKSRNKRALLIQFEQNLVVVLVRQSVHQW